MSGLLRRNWALPMALLCALLVWQPVFTAPAERFNSEVFGSALRVYAVLRGINAAISVAKETEVGVQFVGSLTTQPGMVLDPIDETVARVADAVFMLAAASGVLSVALDPLAQMGALLAGLGFLAVWAAGLAGVGIPPSVLGALRSGGRTLGGLGLVLALALPLGYGLGGRLGTFWTADAWHAAQARLSGEAQELVAAVEDAAEPRPGKAGAERGPSDENPSFMERVLEGAVGAGDAAGDTLRGAVPDLDYLQQRGGEIVESSLTLIAIYVFRLVVLPFVLFWLAFTLTRRVLAS
ncbi:hypothetical protein DKT77_17305 [Meridianimarinicoccus roseus]|uniref:Uncharacterized protein n=1 Tax=Meridianimarinicoccus roseus TaxID=2072018 RepID=A0A2V2LC55_9RHOB|nr:hypothetical protein [Meridianimarinicoccus roseus]PWR01321.1 hypothetical protein DKT77_17305 [Meridianimarinicoccus roseus]